MDKLYRKLSHIDRDIMLLNAGYKGIEVSVRYKRADGSWGVPESEIICDLDWPLRVAKAWWERSEGDAGLPRQIWPLHRSTAPCFPGLTANAIENSIQYRGYEVLFDIEGGELVCLASQREDRV